jgi:radical SAM superfamily enzyme YgiQ (UPF0313 family)
MNRVLFIVPPHITHADFVNPPRNARIAHRKHGDFGSVLTDMPLGVLALSAYAKKHLPVETRLADFNVALNRLEEFSFGSFYEFFREYLAAREWSDYAPQIIGISALFTTSYQSMLDIARCCRAIFPQAIIVAGGGVPTNLFRDVFRDSDCFDALCYAEGERPLVGLLEAEDKLRHLEESPSWITRRKVALGESSGRDFVENLDEIPFYDYGICNTQEYEANPAMTAYASVDGKEHNFHVMTSRGCVHRCCFCSSHTVHGRKMRYYSVERVREDFRRLRDDLGAKTLVFQDDHFVGDKSRALAIIGIVKELQLTAVFQNGLALYALDRKMLEALKAAGVGQLVLAVESGSDRVLKEIMHKPLDLSIVRRVAEDCRELGIYTNVNILIGLPGETKADIEDARAFLKSIDANWFIILCATPLVGSEMLDICLRKNYLQGSYLECDYKKAAVATEDFTAEYIQDAAYLLNLDLNFVNNSDFRLGRFEMALKGFENAIRARSDHAMAYYYAGQCYERLGDPTKAAAYKGTAARIAVESPFWRRYLNMFQIAI